MIGTAPYLIIIDDPMCSTISVVAEQIAAASATMVVVAPVERVAKRSLVDLNLERRFFGLIEVKREFEMPVFDVRPLREKPRRDWEQRLPGRRRR